MTDLVRVRIGDVEKNVGAGYAAAHNLTVLDEPTHNPDGTVRRTASVTSAPVVADSAPEPAPKKKSSPELDTTAEEASK